MGNRLTRLLDLDELADNVMERAMDKMAKDGRVMTWQQALALEQRIYRINQKDVEKLTIKIKYLCPALLEIEHIAVGNWIDLRSAARMTIRKGDTAMIPLGVAMQLPEGYEAIVAPRSSTLKRWGIIMTNSIGIIDESYCGDDDQWWFPAYALRDTLIDVNDRICQFRIIKHQPDIEFVEVKKLGNQNRGGFGSTGED